MLLKSEKDGILYGFGDIHQCIQSGDRSIPDGYFLGNLSYNFRNTQEIFTLVDRFYLNPRQVQMSAIGPEGTKADLVVVEERDLLRQLQKKLEELKDKQKIDCKDIVILTGRSTKDSKRKSLLTYQQRLGCFRIVAEFQKENDVVFHSIRRFKGLESKVVIVIELEKEEQDVWYVGMSRAMSHLIVLGTKETIELIGEKPDRLAEAG